MESDAERSEDENDEKSDKDEEGEGEIKEEVEVEKKKRYKHVRDGSAIFLQVRDENDDGDDDYERPYQLQPIFSTAPPKKEDEPEIVDPSKNVEGEKKKKNSTFLFMNQGYDPSDDDNSDQEIDFRFDEIQS